MDIQSKENGEEKPMTRTLLYGIVFMVVALAAVILVARYAFNVDLVNFDQLLGMTKTERYGK